MSKVIALDVEATALDPKICRVIEIAVVDYETDEVLMHTYVDPESPIPEEATAINHITDDMVRGAPKFRELAPRLHELIVGAEVVVGYNPFYDRTMINAEFSRLGDVLPKWNLVICAKRLWDRCEPPLKRNLTNAYKRFVNDQGFEGAHGALHDTKATLRVFKSQRQIFELNDLPWDQLDPEVKQWWGPSSHILMIDGILTVNFGKFEKRPVTDVDHGYWRWLEGKTDFPDHVVMLSIKAREMIEKHLGAEWLTTWAKGYL